MNELPCKLRMQKQNILLGGLWFGYPKPNMQHFLRPMWKASSRLELQGTLVQAWANLQKFVSKIILLAGTCDLPAKWLTELYPQHGVTYVETTTSLKKINSLGGVLNYGAWLTDRHISMRLTNFCRSNIHITLFNLDTGPRSHTHIYPYISENPSGPLRSRKQTAEDDQHYLETGSTRNGVLGPSWFGCLRYFEAQLLITCTGSHASLISPLAKS